MRRKRTAEHNRKISEAHKRIGSPWNIGRKKSPLTEEHKRKAVATRMKNGSYRKLTEEERKKKRLTARKGENHYNWKGGVTSINGRIRASLEYRLWRESVFKRDNYTCVWCKQIGGQLNADHIKPFAHYPELRFAIDNGRTLCVGCHKTTDTYLSKGKKRYICLQ